MNQAMSWNVIQTAIPDVFIFEPKVFGDDRGFFFESFNHQQFENRHWPQRQLCAG